MYLNNNSKLFATRRVERSQLSSSLYNTAARDRWSRPQRSFLYNAATGGGPAMKQAAPLHEADSIRGSPARSISIYSQDDTSRFESTGVSWLGSAQHQRNEPLHVNWTQEDVKRMAKEIYEESIAAVHLSLLGYWICENAEHYDIAKAYIRELSLDRGYSVKRIKNDHLRELLVSTESARPVQAVEKIASKAAPVVHFEQSQADENSCNKLYLAKVEVLPSSLRRKPESAIQEYHSSGPLASPIREYPPNTPDRPQPLSLRLRYSGKSSATPTSSNRSVSTPIIKSNRRTAIPFPRNSIGLDEITSQLSLLTSPIESFNVSNGRGDTDDVFGITRDEHLRGSDPFDLSNAISTVESEDRTQDHGSLEHGFKISRGRYELASSDASSRTGHNGAGSLRSSSLHGAISEPSVLESDSSDKDNDGQTQYRYGSSSPAPAPTSGSGPSPRFFAGRLRHRTSKWAQTFLFGPRPNLTTGDFYRPNLFPTSGAVDFTTTYTTESRSETVAKDYDGDDDLPSSPSRNTLERDSINQILAGFPIPTVTNPVLALPMLVSAATTPPDSSSPFDSSNDPDVLANQLRITLTETRARGERLPLEDWNTMSPFEKTWRETNEELLVWIYGRQDTWLSPGDVSSVDCVAREIKANRGHCVVDVLREEAEMF